MAWIYVITAAFLIPCTVWDIRSRVIPIRWFGISAAVAAVVAGYEIYIGSMGMLNLLTAISPGLGLLALSLITEQQIGAGDGICAIILGVLLGMPRIFVVIMAALLLSSGWAAFLLVSHRGSRRSRMPFIPFMAAGALIVMILKGGFA